MSLLPHKRNPQPVLPFRKVLQGKIATQISGGSCFQIRKIDRGAVQRCAVGIVFDDTAFERVAGLSSGDLCKTKRSEEHTSELQSRGHLVCRLLLEKKKKKQRRHN